MHFKRYQKFYIEFTLISTCLPELPRNADACQSRVSGVEVSVSIVVHLKTQSI